jgi:hypothetical protein
MQTSMARASIRGVLAPSSADVGERAATRRAPTPHSRGERHSTIDRVFTTGR